MTEVRVEDIHFEISKAAVKIANDMLHEDARVGIHIVNPFSAGDQHTISIQIDPSIAANPEIYKITQEIGREAIRRALVQEQDLFVGLILGSSRKKINYFARHYDSQ